MLEHLMTPENQVTFLEVATDRDGEEVCTFTIGTGYGIFSSLSTMEMSIYRDNKYRSVGVIVHYTKQQNPSVKVNGITYEQVATVPCINRPRRSYKAVWHGTTYDISGVSAKYDIHGNFIGYRIYSTNE